MFTHFAPRQCVSIIVGFRTGSTFRNRDMVDRRGGNASKSCTRGNGGKHWGKKNPTRCPPLSTCTSRANSAILGWSQAQDLRPLSLGRTPWGQPSSPADINTTTGISATRCHREIELLGWNESQEDQQSDRYRWEDTRDLLLIRNTCRLISPHAHCEVADQCTSRRNCFSYSACVHGYCTLSRKRLF